MFITKTQVKVFAEYSNNIDNKLFRIGQNFFYLGTFLLPWAFPISAFSYFIALLISIKCHGKKFFKDKWNIPLYFAALLMILSSLKAYFLTKDFSLQEWDRSLALISLFNWLPFFFLFRGFQIYLRDTFQRILFSKYFLAGSSFVLISCILQYHFEIYGPFKYLFGLVIWYQKPLDLLGGVSGLFNNPNYAGIWLASILPFNFFFIKKHKKEKYKLFSATFISFLTIYLIFLTNSRNSIFGIFIATIFMFGIKAILLFLFLLLLGYLIFISMNKFAILNLSYFFESIIPTGIFNKLSPGNFSNGIQFIRLEIWQKTIKLISIKPLLGWGAGTFAILYLSIDGSSNSQHSHNLPLEISLINGIPASVILTLFVTFLFFKAYRKVFKKINKEESINKAWLSSTLILIISHLSDITYYDGKISILIWILLSGLKGILDNK